MKDTQKLNIKVEQKDSPDMEKMSLQLAKLSSDVAMLTKWANDVNTMVIPSLDAATMLSLYIHLKDSDVELPEEWDGRQFVPIQKKIDEMSKLMDAYAEKVKAKQEELQNGTAKKTV